MAEKRETSMSKQSGSRGKPAVILINASLVESAGSQHFLLINNNTLIKVQLQEQPYRDSQQNELLYVIIVIVFYATALMTLIITQIKRQRREGTEIDYYDEYLQRNSEVKQTCQTANSIVSRKSSRLPPPALATAAFAAAAAGTLLGRVPLIADDVTDNLLNENADYGSGDSSDTSRPGLVSASSGGFGSRIIYPRDKSPMLESIPDEEG